MYLALKKCKNDCKILKIILVPDFCPLKPEIAGFSIRFHLNVWFQKISILILRRVTRNSNMERSLKRQNV